MFKYQGHRVKVNVTEPAYELNTFADSLPSINTQSCLSMFLRHKNQQKLANTTLQMYCIQCYALRLRVKFAHFLF